MAKSVAVFSSGAEQKEQISGFLKFQQVRRSSVFYLLSLIVSWEDVGMEAKR